MFVGDLYNNIKMEIDKEDTIEIGKTHNSYFLKNYWWEDSNEQGNKLIDSDITVFEIEDAEDGDRKAFIRLVYSLAEHLGFMNDKYGEHNLDVNFNKKGHKL